MSLHTIKSARTKDRVMLLQSAEGSSELLLSITQEDHRGNNILGQIRVDRDELREALDASVTPAPKATWLDETEGHPMEKGAHWVTPISGNHVLNDIHDQGVDVNLSINPAIPGVVQIIVSNQNGADMPAFVSAEGLSQAVMALVGWSDAGAAAKLAKVEDLIAQWRREGIEEEHALSDLVKAMSDFELPTKHASVIEGRMPKGRLFVLTLLGSTWYSTTGAAWSEARIYATLTGLRLLREGMDLPAPEE